MDIEKSFRHTKSLTDSQTNAIQQIEDAYCSLALGLRGVVDSREKSLALTCLQISKMFATECIAKNYGD